MAKKKDNEESGILADLRKSGNLITADQLEDDSLVSTGLLSLDVVLGGGVPKGHMIEIFGTPEGGKTTLTYAMINEIQKLGKRTCIAIVENRASKKYLESSGIDLQNCDIFRFLTAEEYFNGIEALLRVGDTGLVIIDSVDALLTITEQEKDMQDKVVGETARLIGKLLRKFSNVVAQSGAVVVFVRQLREKIGVIYGSNESRSGGKSIPFYASTILDLRRKEFITKGARIEGFVSKVKVVKGRSCSGRLTEFDYLYGKGIDFKADIITAAIEIGIVEKTGSWCSYEETRWQGTNLEDEKVLFEIRDKVLSITRRDYEVVQKQENSKEHSEEGSTG